MKQKISIHLFNKHIADMFQNGDRVYLSQVDDLCYKASPVSLSKDVKEIETTHLYYLEKVAGFISDSLPGNFGNEILQNFFLTNTKQNRLLNEVNSRDLQGAFNE